jgi:hypothetical protein
MKLTQITVSYGATQTLPEYSNCKSSITLTAELGPDDDRAAVESELWALARASVHEEIDCALEANDRPAKYDTASPRFQVVKNVKTLGAPLVVVIAPNDAVLPEHIRFLSANYAASHNLRIGHARRIAAETAENSNAAVIDCSDGDLTPILAMLLPKQTDEIEIPF